MLCVISDEDWGPLLFPTPYAAIPFSSILLIQADNKWIC